MAPDLESFRQETRAWLEEHAPAGLRGTRSHPFAGYWGGRRQIDATPDKLAWLEVMAGRGWTAPTWPEEYGGGGLGRKQAKILAAELARLSLPPPLVGFGLVMLGPTLLEFGNEEQKRAHLPAICRGEIRWCQGYSEPNAGSDLASLQCRAERDGDSFVVNGQKVWTSYADLSDRIFCLVRTNSDGPRQSGISFLLIDLDDPGISVRPIRLISGASPFCEVFFEDVRVPAENLVAQIDAGWTVAKALLRHERAFVGEIFASAVGGGEPELVRLARRYVGPEEGPLADALIRDELAANAMDEEAFLLTLGRVKENLRAGDGPGPTSSILKVEGTELNQRRRALAMRIAGPRGLGWEGPGFEADELELCRQWLRSRGNSIEGGTTEIQLNIIAKRVLGLPTGGKG